MGAGGGVVTTSVTKRAACAAMPVVAASVSTASGRHHVRESLLMSIAPRGLSQDLRVGNPHTPRAGDSARLQLADDFIPAAFVLAAQAGARRCSGRKPT